MQATLVLTLIGVDRPGLVKALSNTATKHGANWEASRMSRLGGRFAGLLQVTLEPSHAEALRRDLEALSEHGLKVVVEGVESLAQLELLSDWGCDLYQGFLGAGALDEAELARFVITSSALADAA